MAIAGKEFADGQLSNVSTAILTVGAGATDFPRLLLIHNDNATNEIVYITLNLSGTDRDVVRMELASEESAEWDVPLTLQAGGIIKARATSATGVSYTLTGAEAT